MVRQMVGMTLLARTKRANRKGIVNKAKRIALALGRKPEGSGLFEVLAQLSDGTTFHLVYGEFGGPLFDEGRETFLRISLNTQLVFAVTTRVLRDELDRNLIIRGPDPTGRYILLDTYLPGKWEDEALDMETLRKSQREDRMSSGSARVGGLQQSFNIPI